MKAPVRIILGCILIGVVLTASAADKLYSGRRLKALIITGGCCHNYELQTDELSAAISEVADVEFTIVNQGGTGTKGEIELYKNPDWAKPYDVVIHNECFADTDNEAYVKSITAAHKAGKPAMVIHCAMHTYRAAKFDDWREFLGVTSRYHDPLANYTVKPVAKEHPIMKGFPETWRTRKDELYIIERVWPNTRPLATSVSEKNGKEQPVIWVHEYNGTRVFGTTFGHSDDTFRDPVYLKVLARAFVWVAGKM